MAINTEKNTYTLLFAIGLVVIVGTLLAAIDASLKDKIRVNKTLEKQQNILYAIGINGTAVVFKADVTGAVVATNKLEGQFYSTPALVDGAIYLRAYERLVAIEK